MQETACIRTAWSTIQIILHALQVNLTGPAKMSRDYLTEMLARSWDRILSTPFWSKPYWTQQGHSNSHKSVLHIWLYLVYYCLHFYSTLYPRKSGQSTSHFPSHIIPSQHLCDIGWHRLWTLPMSSLWANGDFNYLRLTCPLCHQYNLLCYNKHIFSIIYACWCPCDVHRCLCVLIFHELSSLCTIKNLNLQS